MWSAFQMWGLEGSAWSFSDPEGSLQLALALSCFHKLWGIGRDMSTGSRLVTAGTEMAAVLVCSAVHDKLHRGRHVSIWYRSAAGRLRSSRRQGWSVWRPRPWLVDGCPVAAGHMASLCAMPLVSLYPHISSCKDTSRPGLGPNSLV